MARDALASDTEFNLIRSETPVDVDGFKLGEPTGEIECRECGASDQNIDEIPHAEDCSQRFATTDYWRNQFLAE